MGSFPGQLSYLLTYEYMNEKIRQSLPRSNFYNHGTDFHLMSHSEHLRVDRERYSWNVSRAGLCIFLFTSGCRFPEASSRTKVQFLANKISEYRSDFDYSKDLAHRRDQWLFSRTCSIFYSVRSRFCYLVDVL